MMEYQLIAHTPVGSFESVVNKTASSDPYEIIEYDLGGAKYGESVFMRLPDPGCILFLPPGMANETAYELRELEVDYE